MVSEHSLRLASVKYFYEKLPSDMTDDELRRYDIKQQAAAVSRLLISNFLQDRAVVV